MILLIETIQDDVREGHGRHADEFLIARAPGEGA
jgi:hypothetical protein